MILVEDLALYLRGWVLATQLHDTGWRLVFAHSAIAGHTIVAQTTPHGVMVSAHDQNDAEVFTAGSTTSTDGDAESLARLVRLTGERLARASAKLGPIVPRKEKP